MTEPAAPKPKKAAAPPKGKPGFSRMGRDSVKHLGVLRGAGTLTQGRRRTPATYQIDVYEGRNQKNGTGVVYGAFRAPKEGEGPAILKLEDGSEVSVVVTGVDEDGVDIETRGDIPGF